MEGGDGRHGWSHQGELAQHMLCTDSQAPEGGVCCSAVRCSVLCCAALFCAMPSVVDRLFRCLVMQHNEFGEVVLKDQLRSMGSRVRMCLWFRLPTRNIPHEASGKAHLNTKMQGPRPNSICVHGRCGCTNSHTHDIMSMRFEIAS